MLAALASSLPGCSGRWRPFSGPPFAGAASANLNPEQNMKAEQSHYFGTSSVALVKRGTLSVRTWSGRLLVEDSEGGVWWPSDKAMSEVKALAASHCCESSLGLLTAEYLLGHCIDKPTLGRWHQ